MKRPFVSIITPTLNAQSYLERCLRSIRRQTYPRYLYEILVVDGGSTDQTRQIARKFGAKVLGNPSRDAESGKSIGIRQAKGSIIALIDADNELIQRDWLSRMVQPLMENEKVFGVESPWSVRRTDPLINQYVTLLRIADPVARRLHPQMKQEKKKGYTIYSLKTGQAPVVGANGFLWRKKYIKIINQYKPKFEEVNYVALMVQHGFLIYARVHGVGIYHHYSMSIFDFIQKRIKIGRKFLQRKKERRSTWVDQSSGTKFVWAVLYNVSVVGPLIETLREFVRSRNAAWFLHPFMSFLTVCVYVFVYIEFFIRNSIRHEA